MFAVGLLGLTLLSVHARAQIISGFGNGSGFTVNKNGNGTAPTFNNDIGNGQLMITNNTLNEARSVFYNTPVAYGSFTASFDYQTSGNKAADGIAFVLQNDSNGVHAIGGLGSGLGYGNSDNDNGGSFIHSSVAVEMNIFSEHTRGTNLQFTTNTNPYNGSYTSTGSVQFYSGDSIHVTIGYNGTLLTTTFLDLSTSQTYTTSYAIDLATYLGGGTAYVGFTGATGGSLSTQTIGNFNFSSVPEPSTYALLGLGLAGLGLSRFRRRS